MSDEKTLFNEDIDKEIEKKEKMNAATDKNSDIVDFSAAFNDDYDDEDEQKEDHEEFEEFVSPISSIIKGLPFLKKKKDEKVDFAEDKTEKEQTAESQSEKHEETAESQPVKEEKKDKKKNKKKDKKKEKSDKDIEKENSQEELALSDAIAQAEEDEDEEESPKPEKEKKFKGFALFGKKESVSAEKTDEPEEIEEQPLKEDFTVSSKESEKDVEDENDEVVIFTDDFEDVSEKEPEKADDTPIILSDKTEETVVEISEETGVIEESVTEQKPEKKRAFGFAFLKKKKHETTPAVTEDEKVSEDTAEESVEILPTFEEQVSAEENQETHEFVEEISEEVKSEKTIEKTEEEIEEMPPFEETAEETIEEIPPFEETAEELPVSLTTAVPEIKKKKKEKKQKPPKEKKEKKSKKAEESTDVQSEKAPAEMMTMKDHLTFILIILALLLTIAFIFVKFVPLGNNGTIDSGAVSKEGENVSAIQIQREGAWGHCIQSDIENVFYMYSQEYNLAYYQCDDGKMISLDATGTVEATVELGQDKLPVKIDYVKMDGQLFGTGIFRASAAEGSYLHSMAIFKLTSLPAGYEQDGKALLLATTNEEAVSQSCNVWTDSYVVDLETGKTTRFLTSDNNIFSTGYSILTDEGYASANGKIPFLTTREYDAVTNKKDVYIKDGNRETPFATDVAGNFVYVDGDAVCYLKSTDDGFNVIRKTNDKESVIFSLRSDTSYMYYNEYLLDKYNGLLYNVKTGEKITVSGYGMANSEMMAVSDDGRYLVVTGTVNSALDYQVHIFDLKTNDYGKYEDDNFSQHENLAFIDGTTVIYSVVDPSQGYEYVILDITKAF